MNTFISFSISTGNSNYATPNLAKFCPNTPNCISADRIIYPSVYEPLYLLVIGNNLVDFNGIDAASFGQRLDSGIERLRTDRGTLAGLTIQQQNLRLAAMEFLIVLREISREHPSCTVLFYP
jgi:hypothetical protein